MCLFGLGSDRRVGYAQGSWAQSTLPAGQVPVLADKDRWAAAGTRQVGSRMQQELISIVSKIQMSKHENTGSKTPLAHQVMGEVFVCVCVLFVSGVWSLLEYCGGDS